MKTNQTRGVPPLRIRSLSMEIPGADRLILNGIDLEAAQGEIIGLVGESGSGKSMTARSIIGLQPQRAKLSGSIEVNGTEMIGAGLSLLRRIRSHDAAMIFQDPRASVNPMRTVGDFLVEQSVLTLRRSKNEAVSSAKELLSEVGFADPEMVLAKYPFQLSGGMLQRIMIASTLMASPSLLLADESTTALDVTTQAEIMRLLRKLRDTRGTAILMITHDLDLAAEMCDRISVMRFGRILEAGSARDVIERPQDPYTRALLASRPSLEGEITRLQPVTGETTEVSTL